MVPIGKTRLIISCLFGIAVFAARGACPAHASGFTAFAQDEDICRNAGTRAIAGASGPSAAQHYDFAYRRCMAAHIRGRQADAAAQDSPPGAFGVTGNPHSFEYPNAFYGIPYATPGYGYDGFGY